MRCPQCGQPCLVAAIADARLQRTAAPVVTRARCCGYGVRLVPAEGQPRGYTIEAEPRSVPLCSFGQQLRQE